MINVRKMVGKINNDFARSNLYMVSFGDLSSFVREESNSFSDSLSTSKDAFSSANRVSSLYKKHGVKGLLAQDSFDSLASIFGTAYSIQRDLGLLVKNINLPGTTVETSVNYDRRYKNHVPVSSTNDTVTMTFYCSPDHAERELFLKWIKSIVSDGNIVGFANDYERKIEAIILGRDGKRNKALVLNKAFPIRVGGVELSYENNNEISVFEVEFTYQRYAYTPVENQSQDWLDGISNAANTARSKMFDVKGIANETGLL